MIEPPQFVIAYWLLPAAPARVFFRETIRHLAARCDAPLFEPHLTLAVRPDLPGQVDQTLAGLASGSIELRPMDLAFTSTFTKTLFVRFASSPPLLRLRASLGAEGDGTFDPHISLLYKKLPEEQQARLAAEIQLPFAAVTFGTVAATLCRLPVATAADVALWESIASRRLDG
jgi:hypothetical protein